MIDSEIERRLIEMGLELPVPGTPIASYRSVVINRELAHVSGQLSMRDGALLTGRLGSNLDLAAGATAAEACGLMVVAQLKAALGDLSRIDQFVKIGVFVNCDPEFYDQPKVANGASDLIVALFGERGQHSRSAVGVASLPLGAAVEVDAVVALRES